MSPRNLLLGRIRSGGSRLHVPLRECSKDKRIHGALVPQPHLCRYRLGKRVVLLRESVRYPCGHHEIVFLLHGLGVVWVRYGIMHGRGDRLLVLWPLSQARRDDLQFRESDLPNIGSHVPGKAWAVLTLIVLALE